MQHEVRDFKLQTSLLHFHIKMILLADYVSFFFKSYAMYTSNMICNIYHDKNMLRITVKSKNTDTVSVMHIQ